mgnify:CR=1 FL=1
MSMLQEIIITECKEILIRETLRNSSNALIRGKIIVNAKRYERRSILKALEELRNHKDSQLIVEALEVFR